MTVAVCETLSHAKKKLPLGGANRFFFKLDFLSTVRAIFKIFSGSCAPRRALLKFRGSGGSNLGNVIFFVFPVAAVTGWACEIGHAESSGSGDPFNL